MNGYICIMDGRRVDLYAKSSYEAQCLAAVKMGVKPKYQYKIVVILAEKNGETVTQVAVD
jgi:hypothetical protein